MYSEELVIGGNAALAEAFVDEYNELVEARKQQLANQEEQRRNQVANMLGNVAISTKRPGFVRR